jgi:hypothetical protein
MEIFSEINLIYLSQKEYVNMVMWKLERRTDETVTFTMSTFGSDRKAKAAMRMRIVKSS